jgi:hypothetical protein
MKSIKILMVLQLAVLSTGVMAQRGQFKVDLNYTVGIPTGNLKELTDKTSWRGGELDLMYGVTDRMSVGLALGTQDFYQKYDRTVLHSPGTDISAVITNSIQTMPIMAKASMMLAPMGPVQPFVSLAAGGNLVEYRKYYGEFTDTRSSFGFVAQPSVGLHVPFGRATAAGFHIAAGYNYMPFKYNDADGLHHAVIKAGISVPLK